MAVTYSFGEWVSQRRKAHDLTQRELATRAACAVATIKKIEADERRPSRELAETIAEALAVTADWRERFIDCARGQRPVDALADMPANAHGGAAADSARSDQAVLPVATTPFVGRETDLVRIGEMLKQPDCRLLTVVGPGGMGKTRLAIEVARAQGGLLEDGAVFVPLAPVNDAALIPSAIAQGLTLPINDPAQLLAYLREQKLLLVLDNCEQFGDGLGWLSELLTSAPGLKLLATSRERLQLAEEWVYPLLELDEVPAVDLFARTAQRAAPEFVVEAQTEEVLTVCQMVDHLPLAIELAAGWTPFMSCAQIAANIQGDIDFLAANVRNVPERHRSLRAVFDHSWQLLSPEEQDALMRLSVFRGGWAVDESAPVAGATLPVLRGLMEKSLVRRLGDGRYDLHELTRQYAAEKLRESGHERETHVAHAEAYIALVLRLYDQLVNGMAATVFPAVDTEQDNFRAILAWSIEQGEAETALNLLAELFFFWLRRGYWLEGERWLNAALALAGEEDNPWVAISLSNLATYIAVQGRYAEVGPHVERSREMAFRLEDTRALITVMELLTQATWDVEEAGAMLRQADDLLATWEHPMKPLRQASVHSLYGDRLRGAGFYDEAAAHFQETLTRRSRFDDPYMRAYALGNLGRVAFYQGRVQEAYDLISESFASSRTVANRVDIADWGWQLGHVLLVMGEAAQAEAYFDEALALYDEVGNQRALPDMLAFLGCAALAQDDQTRAADYFRQSLTQYQDTLLRLADPRSDWSNNPNIAFVSCLMGTAVMAAGENDPTRVVTLLGYIDIRPEEAHLVEGTLQAQAEAALEQARAQLSDAEFEAAWAAGQGMSLAEVLALP